MRPPGRPRLVRWARLRHDRVRARDVLLAPERALLLSASAAETVALCDGRRTLAEIAGELHRRHPEALAAVIQAHLEDLLAELAARGLVEDG